MAGVQITVFVKIAEITDSHFNVNRSTFWNVNFFPYETKLCRLQSNKRNLNDFSDDSAAPSNGCEFIPFIDLIRCNQTKPQIQHFLATANWRLKSQTIFVQHQTDTTNFVLIIWSGRFIVAELVIRSTVTAQCTFRSEMGSDHSVMELTNYLN